jgi:thiol-disulfide isomerase/thioredoxin
VPKLVAATRDCAKDADCLKPIDAEWQALLAKHPQSIPLHRQYQNAWGAVDKERLGREYKKILDAHPDEAYALTLYARALAGTNGKEEQMALLMKALERDPKYPWAHFSLAWRYTGRNDEKEKDYEKAKPHVLAFAEACPNSLFSGSFAHQLGDKELQAKVAELARGGVDKLPPEQAVRRYASIWASAFRTVPVSEHNAVRERLKAEISKVRAMKLEDSREWWSALEQGYKLTGEKAGQIEAQNEIARRFPCEMDGIRFAIQGWERANPSTAAAPQSKALSVARHEFTRTLVERCPKTASAWSHHYYSALGVPDLPRKELERVIDSYLDLYGRPEARFVSWPSPYQTVAELYMDRGFRLDHVKGLIEKDRLQSASDREEPRANATAEERARIELARRQSEWRTLQLTARAEHKLGHEKERAAALAKLATMRDAETDTRAKAHMAAQYAWLRADVAASEKRWADAFGLYQQAAAGLPGESRVKRGRDQAWDRLGGSSDVLAKLLESTGRSATATATSAWTTVERSLPEATLDRVGGGQWTTAAFEGKRTLVNLWATWCGPCVQELPHIQKLHDRIKDRTDIAIVTLNVDDSVGLVEPFLAENKYTFPVVFAESYWDKLDVRKAIPTNWVVDAAGVVRLEHAGWNAAAADKWVDDAIGRLDPKSTAAAAN